MFTTEVILRDEKFKSIGGFNKKNSKEFIQILYIGKEKTLFKIYSFNGEEIKNIYIPNASGISFEFQEMDITKIFKEKLENESLLFEDIISLLTYNEKKYIRENNSLSKIYMDIKEEFGFEINLEDLISKNKIDTFINIIKKVNDGSN